MKTLRPKVIANANGFSLIEIAVVLVVLTIILATIAQPVANQIETRRIADTQKKLEEVKEALYGFALSNGRLPQPAKSKDDGTENTTACSIAPEPEVACTGLIPWVTLGIDKGDGWGTIIRYSVSPIFSTNTFTLSNLGTKNVVTRADTLPLKPVLAANVAALVWSHGKRNFGRDAVSGTPRFAPPPSSNADERHNDGLPAISGSPSYDAGTAVYSRLPTDNPGATGGEFDDLVSWLPTSILMGKMVQAGRLPR